MRPGASGVKSVPGKARKVYRGFEPKSVVAGYRRTLIGQRYVKRQGECGLRISDNVYMLSGAPYSQIGNVYAVRGNGGFFLVDCGQGQAAREIIQGNLDYYQFGRDVPSHIFVTHAHIDHTGNAWYFQKRGARIVCHPLDRAALEQGGELVTDYAWEEEFTPCRVCSCFEDGQMLKADGIELQAIYAPGHSGGSTVFLMRLDGRKMLFTGDTISTQLSGWGKLEAQLGWEGGYDMDRSAYLETLHKLYRLDIDCLLPGHGIPAMLNGTQILKNAFCQGLLKLR